MMSKRKEDWIKIVTPDNENKIASPSYIKKLLNVDLSNIYNRLIRMESKIDKLESPKRQEKIIEALRDQGRHSRIWLDNRVSFRGYDLRDLIEKGIIIESKSGTQPMIELSAFKENDPLEETRI